MQNVYLRQSLLKLFDSGIADLRVAEVQVREAGQLLEVDQP